MELRKYGKILWRRIWIPTLVIGVALIYVAYQFFGTNPTTETRITYKTSVALRIGISSTAQIEDSTQYLAMTETVADEFATGPLLTSPSFLSRVIEYIDTNKAIITARFGENANVGELTEEFIASSIIPARFHSTVTVSVEWGTEAGAWAIAYAIGQVSVRDLPTEQNYNIAGQPSAETGNLSAIAEMLADPDAPIPSDSVVATRKNTGLLLLLLVSIIIGIALAFLVEYLDDRIYEPEEVIQTLQIPIYGEVPRAPAPGRPAPSSTTPAV